jgi:hypothetical protein
LFFLKVCFIVAPEAVPVANNLPLSSALPQIKSAFSKGSNSVPGKAVWVDSEGSGVSFPILLKQQQALSIAKTEAEVR